MVMIWLLHGYYMVIIWLMMVNNNYWLVVVRDILSGNLLQFANLKMAQSK